jgi:hypothetical protein
MMEGICFGDPACVTGIDCRLQRSQLQLELLLLALQGSQCRIRHQVFGNYALKTTEKPYREQADLTDRHLTFGRFGFLRRLRKVSRHT